MLLIATVLAVTFSSCYSTKITVGDLSPNEPMIKVNSEWNHHLIGGLIPLGNAKMRADDYVGDRDRYMVKTNQSFLNGLVGFLTLSIYTPTTTSYYLPLDQNSLEGEYLRRIKDLDKDKKTKNFYSSDLQEEVVPIVVVKDVELVEPTPPKTNTRASNEVVAQRIEKKPTTTTVQTKSVGQVSVNERQVASKPEPQTPTGDYRATIYFKDGARMDGTVTAESTDTVIKIKLLSGLVIESKVSEIEKIEKK